MTSGGILVLMGILFLAFGYMGVPVSFALMAGVFVATAFTPVSLQSMVGQLFHGIDAETLLAVPFFGEEELQLVFDDGAADGAAEVLDVQGSFRLVRLLEEEVLRG